MDWARDNAGLSDRDLDNVFKYEEKSTIIVRMLAEKDKGPVVWSLRGKTEWRDWIENECPNIDGSASGLVLILAKRTGEPSFPSAENISTEDWLETINEKNPEKCAIQRANTFASLGEKNNATEPTISNMSGRRGVRTLPFSKDVFELVANNFHVHGSIARVISRADVPVFSSSEIQMQDLDGSKYPAYVYNCRTSNAWDMDLAFTATYFPHCGLTFGVLFGCSLSIEGEILRRLSSGMSPAEAAHPLLVPGIMTEIERARHVHIVEATIDHLETKIFELDSDSSSMEQRSKAETEERNHSKRSAWLDTTYLRNGLVSWNTQLAKIKADAEEIHNTAFATRASGSRARLEYGNNGTGISSSNTSILRLNNTGASSSKDSRSSYAISEDFEVSSLDTTEQDAPQNRKWEESEEGVQEVIRQAVPQVESKATAEQLQRVGRKISGRVQAIIDEYDDKIRDCTMRVDGMAMATQWAQGETNVEIALATSRDSRHMRSIALVTMIFLPGTFFATVFSMTFFNWSGSSGHIVSGYFWIYVVVALVFTLLTVGAWWYFNAYLHSRLRKDSSKEELSIV